MTPPVPNDPGPYDFVLDAAVAVAWVLPVLASVYTDNVQSAILRKKAIVPATWLADVAQAVRAAERRRRATPAYVDGKLAGLAGFPIGIDDETAVRLWSDTLALSRTHRVTVADAAYLELALRRRLPLATTDAALAAAAASAGVPIYSP